MRPRLHRLFALVPPLTLMIGVPFANRVHAYVLGMPFLLFWIVASILLTSAVMAVVGAIDRRLDAQAAEGATRREPR